MRQVGRLIDGIYSDEDDKKRLGKGLHFEEERWNECSLCVTVLPN